MKKTFLLIFLVLLLKSETQACGGLLTWVYTGDISYSLDSLNPLNCSVIISLEFDIPDNLSTDSIFVNWGDGTIGTIWATGITADSVANNSTGANVYYKHVYAGKHTYAALPDSGFYIISPVNQFRINGISNVDEGTNAATPFYIEAHINTDSAAALNNHSPRFTSPFLIAFASTHTPFDESVMAYTDGDSVAFDFAVPLMDHLLTVDEYFPPGEYCNEFGDSALFTINHHTGEITWTAPCTQGTFAVTIVVSTYRNGHLLGSVMRDQMIYVDIGSVNGISSYPAAKEIQIFPNPASDVLSGTVNTIDSKNVSLEVISIDGSSMMKNIPVKEDKFNVDVSALGAGLYFVQIHDGIQTVVKKFMKQ